MLKPAPYRFGKGLDLGWFKTGLLFSAIARRRGFGPFDRLAHGAGTSRAVSGFPRGYISPNFKVLTSNIPAREHRTPTHERRERN
jgi:hypothetical protein